MSLEGMLNQFSAAILCLVSTVLYIRDTFMPSGYVQKTYLEENGILYSTKHDCTGSCWSSVDFWRSMLSRRRRYSFYLSVWLL